jgi:DsbC/DsbD-like thiol-disulfide interchange protein
MNPRDAETVAQLGVAAIDLNRVPSATAEGWRIYPRLPGEAGLPFYYSVWQQGVSIYQNIPQNTIEWSTRMRCRVC